MGSHDMELNLGLQVSLQEGVGCSFVSLCATGLHCNPEINMLAQAEHR